MTFQTVTPDELEAIAFDHPGSQIKRYIKNGVEIRKLRIAGDEYEARVTA